MSYIDKVQVKGTDYDIRDNRMKLKDQVSHGFRNNIVSSTSRGGVFNSFRNQFKSTVASTTSITISTGAATKNGLYYSTVSDQTITIPLASSGNARKDLIVVRWEIRDNSESTYGQLVRIAGTEVTKTGSTSAIPEPSYNDSVVNVDILTPGKTYTVDLPLYMVIVDGTNGIIEVGKIFSEIYDNSYLSDKITELDTAVNKLNTEIVTQEFSIGSADNSNYYGEFLYYIHIPTSIFSKKIISYNVVSTSGVGVIRSVNLSDDYLIMVTNSNSNNGKVKFRFVLQSKS